MLLTWSIGGVFMSTLGSTSNGFGWAVPPDADNGVICSPSWNPCTAS
jgi:hypothetical protein